MFSAQLNINVHNHPGLTSVVFSEIAEEPTKKIARRSNELLGFCSLRSG